MKKPALAKHRQLNYQWLLSQASDETTAQNVRRMIAEREHFIKTGKQSADSERLTLVMKGCIINAISNQPYSTMMTYQEIFYNHEHQRAPGFRQAHSIIDVGANEGMYTLSMCLANQKLRAICIEPNPKTYQLLTENMRSNGLTDRVTLINAAVWSNNEPQTLVALPGNTSNTSLQPSAHLNPWLSMPIAKHQLVPTVTLQQVVAELDGTVDIVKIDTEGSEGEILQAARKCFDRIQKIVVEYHSDPLREQVIASVTEAGFTLALETRDEEFNTKACGNLYFSR